MESVELKLKGIVGQYPVVCTRKVVEMLRNPVLSIELERGQPSEDVRKLLDELDYHVEAKEFDGWVMLKASKQKK
ncbi:MAG: hypothetical protein H6Q55_3051 [Deltaproteobacteria bacterium]|jgi:hypothetical protein|nr:hypothetical protein [Deltaproteobacteria bacterium]